MIEGPANRPLLFDAPGRLELDLGLFLAAYPWLLRAPIGRFVAPGVAAAYREPRHVIVDLAANLVKERLEGWIPAVLEAVETVVEPAITSEEVHRHYRSDARLWEAMLRLRRADHHKAEQRPPGQRVPLRRRGRRSAGR